VEHSIIEAIEVPISLESSLICCSTLAAAEKQLVIARALTCVDSIGFTLSFQAAIFFRTQS
jgi:hypothetical protein